MPPAGCEACPAGFADIPGFCRQWGTGLCLPFWWFCQERGSVYPTIITGAQSPAHCPQSTPWPALSTLCLVPGWCWETTLLCEVHWVRANHPNNPHSLLARQLRVLGSCPVCLSSPFEKSLCVCRCRSEPLPGFRHTPTLWQVQSLFSQGQSRPTSSLSSRCCQDLLHSLLLSQVVAVTPAWVQCQLCTCVLFPLWLYAFRSFLAWVCDFPALGGEGAARLLSLTWLSSDVVPVAAAVSGTMPRDFPCLPIKPPYRLFWSILCTPWLPNFISGKILLTVHFVFQKFS